jgi:hypothetical protein
MLELKELADQLGEHMKLECANGHTAVIRQDPNSEGVRAICDTCGWSAPYLLAEDGEWELDRERQEEQHRERIERQEQREQRRITAGESAEEREREQRRR